MAVAPPVIVDSASNFPPLDYLLTSIITYISSHLMAGTA